MGSEGLITACAGGAGTSTGRSNRGRGGDKGGRFGEITKKRGFLNYGVCVFWAFFGLVSLEETGNVGV